MGSGDGYLTVIVRSDAGKRLLENVDCIKGDVNVEDVIKLAKFKKKRADKNFSAIIKGAQNYKEL